MTAAPAARPRPMWQIVLGLVAAVLLVVLAVLALPALQPEPPEASGGRAGWPWEIELRPGGGTTVLGLTVGGATPSTLEDAQSLWPQEVMQVALLADREGRPQALEAYLESVRVGGLQGKLVLTARSDPAALAAWAARAARSEPQPSGARQLSLAAADLAEARRQPLAGLVFLPAARLEEATLQQRFGTPELRLASPDGAVHLLYPARGVAIGLDPQARERPVLQYVAPAEFEDRLHAPLRAASAAASAAAPAGR